MLLILIAILHNASNAIIKENINAKRICRSTTFRYFKSSTSIHTMNIRGMASDICHSFIRVDADDHRWVVIERRGGLREEHDVAHPQVGGDAAVLRTPGTTPAGVGWGGRGVKGGCMIQWVSRWTNKWINDLLNEEIDKFLIEFKK